MRTNCCQQHRKAKLHLKVLEQVKSIAFKNFSLAEVHFIINRAESPQGKCTFCSILLFFIGFGEKLKVSEQLFKHIHIKTSDQTGFRSTLGLIWISHGVILF